MNDFTQLCFETMKHNKDFSLHLIRRENWEQYIPRSKLDITHHKIRKMVVQKKKDYIMARIVGIYVGP